MKCLHRPDLFSWSTFDAERNIDFHGTFWRREGGNVAIDPLPLSEHDKRHVESLGGIAIIVITNSDHVRGAEQLAQTFGARVLGPAAESDRFPISCQGWLKDGDEVVPGLRVVELAGSKTPGELALILEGTTLITGDLVRSHRPPALGMLPDAKLQNRDAARASIARLASMQTIEAVIVGDGWSVFENGHAKLRALAVT